MPDRVARLVLVLFVGAIFVPARLGAQWSVDGAIGSSTHPAIASALDTDNLIATIRYSGAFWLEVAGGVPLGEESQGWGSAGVGGRWLSGGTGAVGIEGSGQLYGYADNPRGLDSDWGALVQLSPLVGLGGDFRRLELSAGPLVTWSASAGDARLFFSASAGGTVRYGSTTLRPIASLIVSDSGSDPYLGISVLHRVGAVGAWAGAGVWTAGPEQEDAVDWSLGSYWNATDRLQLFGSFDREATDPIFGTTPRNSWALGLSLVMGRSPGRARPIQPLQHPAGTVEIAIGAGEVRGQPMLGGDFNGWTPQAMVADGDRWVIRLLLDPGVYHYAFVTPDGRWFLPESVEYRVADPYGGENGVLVVQ